MDTEEKDVSLPTPDNVTKNIRNEEKNNSGNITTSVRVSEVTEIVPNEIKKDEDKNEGHNIDKTSDKQVVKSEQNDGVLSIRRRVSSCASQSARERKRQDKVLAKQWDTLLQEKKKQPVSITFSYYEGVGTRREISVPAGYDIGSVLSIIRRALKTDPTLKGLTIPPAQELLFVCEDVIVPHGMVLMEIELADFEGVTGRMADWGSSGHPIKIVPRDYYNSYKHAFPLCNWTTLDITKKKQSNAK